MGVSGGRELGDLVWNELTAVGVGWGLYTSSRPVELVPYRGKALHAIRPLGGSKGVVGAARQWRAEHAICCTTSRAAGWEARVAPGPMASPPVGLTRLPSGNRKVSCDTTRHDTTRHDMAAVEELLSSPDGASRSTIQPSVCVPVGRTISLRPLC
jgi:hypothetical protein